MYRFNSQNGFTLVEIIAVLLVIGILTAVAASRFTSTNSDIVVQKEITLNHLRYAQVKAISTNTPWYIEFSKTGTTYTYQLFKGNESAPRTFPGEESPTVKSLFLSIENPEGSIVSYNQWGEPAIDRDGEDLQPEGNDRTLTFTKDSTDKTITIVANTGLLR